MSTGYELPAMTWGQTVNEQEQQERWRTMLADAQRAGLVFVSEDALVNPKAVLNVTRTWDDGEVTLHMSDGSEVSVQSSLRDTLAYLSREEVFVPEKLQP